MKCPHCNHELTLAQIAALMGSIGGKATTEAKAKAARDNGKKGGRPKKSPQKQEAQK